MDPQAFEQQISQILAIQRQLQEDQIRCQSEIVEMRGAIAEVKAVSENNVQAIAEIRGAMSEMRGTIAEMRGTIERMIQLVAIQQGNQEGTQAQLRLLEERVTRLESR
jgi:transcriptional/translational regulatory protein YebC/TACO1